MDDCLRRDSEDMYAASVEMMERYLLTRVLRHAQGNQSQAARMLGITRGSLRNKMRSLRIQVGSTVQLEDFDTSSRRRRIPLIRTRLGRRAVRGLRADRKVLDPPKGGAGRRAGGGAFRRAWAG